ncbi:hypothetical protein J2S43_001941 [Catenuloplanes nepalensis]|uniref:TrbL/VirB6 plasmid conjugal transfer protein n=1 Tax=Catenuloplanes nepalensis TaxID=587533 RepID=A0ABT9MPV2_9ACTN|nr:hypothetical protein [Catenuloplanes nepalensis]MDP9793429.1 hypothetical protein [Catenuloplanes nepalensis]
MPDCSNGDIVYVGAFSGLTELFDTGIDGLLRKIASAIMNAAASLFGDLALNVPTLSVDDDINHKIGLQTNWLVVTIAVASLLFAAARMALERRGQPGITAVKGVLRLILVAGAGSFVLIQLALLSDRYTEHLFKAGVKEQLKSIASCDNADISTFLIIIIGLLLLIAGLIHIVLLYIRLGVMVLLVGTLPLAAVASMTEWGSSWWRKHIAWMTAWLIYKPAVGLIFYVGATMIAYTGENAVQQKIAGCGVLLMAAVALPGLLRLVVPATMALGNSDGASGAVASGAGAAAQATGAVGSAGMRYAMRGGRGGGRSGGASGGRGATGAAGATGGGAGGGTGGGGAGGGRSVGRAIASGAGRAASGAIGGAALVAAKASTTAVKHGTNLAQGAVSGNPD